MRSLIRRSFDLFFELVLPKGFFFSTKGFCNCCDRETKFVSYDPWLRDRFICSNCYSIPRERALIHVLESAYPNWKELKIHESSPGKHGASLKIKKNCKNYTSSQFFTNQKLGIMIDGFRNENLEDQTFGDDEFDIVITQDVMEHVYHPSKAFSEIARTLKPRGAHIFSVPLVNKHAKTEVWATLNEDGSPHFLNKPEYHKNPIDKDGSPVTMHWGFDIVEIIKETSNLNTDIIHLDDLHLGIRAEFIEILVSKKN